MKLGFADDDELESQFRSFAGEHFASESTIKITGIDKADFLLRRDGEGVLSLQDVSHGSWKPLTVDFLSEDWKFRLARTWNSREVLRQALGAKRGAVLKIVDATGGLLSDAYLMAEWGHDVIAFEQNILLAYLGAEACARVEVHRPLNTLAKKRSLRFVPGRFEAACLDGLKADVVYLDPMYPDKKKSALNSKEMRIVKKCTESMHHWSDGELSELIKECLSQVSKRVVLKRPVWAPQLPAGLNDLLSYELKGKGTKFCVFQAQALSVSSLER